MKEKDAFRSTSGNQASDTEASLAEGARRSRDEELERLYAELGRLLFERTKREEEFYLLDPELYLAIERLDAER